LINKKLKRTDVQLPTLPEMETDTRQQLKITLYYRTQYKGSSEFRRNIKQRLPMQQLETDELYNSKSDVQKLMIELSWTWGYINTRDSDLHAEILNMYNASQDKKSEDAMDLTD